MIVTVLTGPEWLAEMKQPATNSSNTAKIEVLRTANNVPYIGVEILSDPVYQEDLNQVANGKTIREWLTEIQIEINPE